MATLINSHHIEIIVCRICNLNYMYLAHLAYLTIDASVLHKCNRVRWAGSVRDMSIVHVM